MFDAQYSSFPVVWVFLVFLGGSDAFTNDSDQFLGFGENSAEFAYWFDHLPTYNDLQGVRHSLSSFRTTPILCIKSFLDSAAWTSA